MIPKNPKADRGRIEIRTDECKGCGLCVVTCPVHCIEIVDALNIQGYNPAHYIGQGCTGCGICFYVCPEPGALTVYTIGSVKETFLVEGKRVEEPLSDRSSIGVH
jgi:2-oxoglutarate ferredoxin oxidoreductase subunit delta